MPNLANYPNIRPSLLLDFANSGSVDPRIECVRATTATRVNSKGLIETVAANVPRIDYSLMTGECLGLLIEEARTNLAPNSGNAALWGFSGTVTGGQASTLGGSTATLLKGPAAGTPSRNMIVNGTAVSYQIAVKQSGAATTASFLIRNSTTATNFNGVTIDFTTGVVTGSGWSVRPAPGGFFILSYTQSTGIASGDTLTFYYGAIGAPTASFELIVDWMQIEVGAFPTSYIPTTTAAVTRAADLPRMNGGNFSEWYRQGEGTLVAEYDKPYGGATPGWSCAACLNDGSTSNRIALYADNSLTAGNLAASIVTNAAVQGISNLTNADPAISHKIAGAFKDSDFSAVLNGGSAAIRNTGGVPAVNRLTLGQEDGGQNVLNGHIRRLAYYPIRLSTAQLQALTAP